MLGDDIVKSDVPGGINIKINFTKKQFRTLLDLAYVGNWVMNSDKEPSEVNKNYEDLQLYIFSFCDDYGFSELVDYVKEEKKHYESREYEETGIKKAIDEYDTHVFLDTLAFELAKRDIGEELILENRKPSHDEWIKRVLEREQWYMEEFDKNGVKNIRLC